MLFSGSSPIEAVGFGLHGKGRHIPARKTKSFFSLDWQRRFVSPQQATDLKAMYCWEREGFTKFLELPYTGSACWVRSQSITIALGSSRLGMWSPGSCYHPARKGNATFSGLEVYGRRRQIQVSEGVRCLGPGFLRLHGVSGREATLGYGDRSAPCWPSLGKPLQKLDNLTQSLTRRGTRRLPGRVGEGGWGRDSEAGPLGLLCLCGAQGTPKSSKP